MSSCDLAAVMQRRLPSDLFLFSSTEMLLVGLVQNRIGGGTTDSMLALMQPTGVGARVNALKRVQSNKIGPLKDLSLKMRHF